jgi:hypothetical protein
VCGIRIHCHGCACVLEHEHVCTASSRVCFLPVPRNALRYCDRNGCKTASEGFHDKTWLNMARIYCRCHVLFAAAGCWQAYSVVPAYACMNVCMPNARADNYMQTCKHPLTFSRRGTACTHTHAYKQLYLSSDMLAGTHVRRQVMFALSA